MKKPVIGQVMFKLNIGNNARRVAQTLTPVVVTKIGRKYFTTERHGNWKDETEFCLDDFSQKPTGYIAEWSLYESEQEWSDEKEASTICNNVCAAFEYGRNKKNLSLEKLREISQILGAPQ